MATMTANQYAMLKAIVESEYQDGEDPPDHHIWTEYVCESFGPKAGGIMSSLVKKGYAGTTGHAKAIQTLESGVDPGTCWITAKGYEAYKSAFGG